MNLNVTQTNQASANRDSPGNKTETMETKDRDTLARLLRRAASQMIGEASFWAEFKAIADHVKEPIMSVALASATRYWQTFHRKKILLFIPARHNAAELRQATDELKLIAAVLETGWQLPELAEKP